MKKGEATGPSVDCEGGVGQEGGDGGALLAMMVAMTVVDNGGA